MTRLNRETNPVPGEKPGYLPQYIDDNGDPINVTPSTPYPTTDKEVIAELAQVKAELQAIKQQSYKEYRILSTDPIPEAKADEKGATLVIMDTGEIKMNHGGTWGDF